MKHDTQSIDLTTDWTEISVDSLMRFFSIYVVSGDINIQYYTDSAWSATITKEENEIYTNTFDVKKFRVAAQVGTARINYSYFEDTLQIQSQTSKTNPAYADLFILEDSEDGSKQKRLNLGDLITE